MEEVMRLVKEIEATGAEVVGLQVRVMTTREFYERLKADAERPFGKERR